MRLVRLGAILGAVVPGLLAGGYVAALLWFLNPDLPLDPGRIVATVALYGAVLAVTSAALLAPAWAGREPRRSFRLLPWTLAAALAAGSVSYAAQASYFAYYLPAGINTRLLKAASWLALGVLVAASTALVHSLNRRPYGLRSRIGLAIVALASLLVVFERREAYRPHPAPTPASTVGEPRAISLVVVGIDGAMPEVVLPLAEQGQLPFFHRMIRGGVFARVTPLRPERPTPTWTTLATGKYPYRHGVKGETALRAGSWPPRYRLELVPVGLAFRAWAPLGPDRTVTASDRGSRALWEILPRLDRQAAVVGWPLVAPAPLAPGFALDDSFFRGDDRGVSTPDLATRASLFRPDEEDLLASVREEFPTHPHIVQEGLRQDLWRAALARTALAGSEEAPIALFLRLPGLEAVSRETFDGYAARVLEGESDAESAAESNTLGGYYRRLDEILAGLWSEMAERPGILVVVSPWGSRPPDRWPLGSDHGSRTADGLFLALGSDVRRGTALQELETVDLMPTILYALALPQARDLDGAARTDAFDPGFVARQPLAFVPSYDTLTRGR